jgi:hypothetical protein
MVGRPPKKKKNKLRVQNVGEMENDKISSNAENMFKESKFQKQQKHNKQAQTQRSTQTENKH